MYIDYVKLASDRLGELIETGYKDFILYPFGKQGRLAKCILNIEYGIQELMLIDEKLDWRGINHLDALKDINNEGAIVLFTSDTPSLQEELLCSLFDVWPKEKCVYLYPDLVEKQLEQIRKDTNAKSEVLNKMQEKHLFDDGMCYKIENGNSVFFIPYVCSDLIQRDIFLNDNYFEIDLLKYFFSIENGLLSRVVSRMDMVILDIGANIGNHTLFFANELGAKRILAFEPVRETFLVLQKNISLNSLKKAVQVYNIGLSDKVSSAGFRTYNYENIGGTSLEEGAGDIPISTIDDMDISRVGFMKIDVEGMELNVLKGGRKTIERDKPIIMIESFPDNYAEVKHYIFSLGYRRVYDYGEADHLFIPENKDRNC